MNPRPAYNILDLHRLVHWLQREEPLAHWTLKVATRLDGVFLDDDHMNRSAWRTYLPHARYVLNSIFIEDSAKDKIQLLWKFGMCLCSDSTLFFISITWEKKGNGRRSGGECELGGP